MRVSRKIFSIIVVGMFVAGSILLLFANRIPTRMAPAHIVWEIRDHNPSDEFDRPGGVLIAPSGDIILSGLAGYSNMTE